MLSKNPSVLNENINVMDNDNYISHISSLHAVDVHFILADGKEFNKLLFV